MNVGIVAFSGMHPFKTGGPQYCIHSIINELSKSSHIYLTLYLRLYEDIDFKLLPRLPNTTIVPFVIKEGREIKLPLAILSIIKRSKTVELVHYNSPPYFIDSLFLKMLNKPLTFDFHGGLFAENLFVNKPSLKTAASLLKSGFKSTAKLFANVIVHSQYMKKIAMASGVPEKRIRLVPLGVDLEEIDNARSITLEGSPTVLFVGRFEPIKGCHVLLRALPQVVSNYPRLRLYIIGKGPQEGHLKMLAKKFNLEKNVRFEGNVPRGNLLSYYKSVDLCIFPSTYNEGFGLSVLEAMASRRAVIASNTGGMQERVSSGEDGYLVDPNDSNALARKTLLLLSDGVLRKRFGENARKVAEAHDWSSIASKYEAVFKEALTGM